MATVSVQCRICHSSGCSHPSTGMRRILWWSHPQWGDHPVRISGATAPWEDPRKGITAAPWSPRCSASFQQRRLVPHYCRRPSPGPLERPYSGQLISSQDSTGTPREIPIQITGNWEHARVQSELRKNYLSIPVQWGAKIMVRRMGLHLEVE